MVNTKINFLNDTMFKALFRSVEARKVEELSIDPNFVGYYDLEEAYRQDIISSYDTDLEEGEASGITKEKLNVAKAMLKDTNDYNLISKYTELSIKKIKELL